MGHLLYLKGDVEKRQMHKLESESTKIGKASFKFAWVLDATEEERSRGVTIDVAQSSFDTATKTVVLLDAPGHRDFIPNMISGATQADAAVLVVNAAPGEFESGFENGGQTQEHTVLLRSLGVQHLIVAVNKMDMCGWAEARFTEIHSKISTFLKKTGFRDSNVRYVPVSGFTGENLVEGISSANCSWFKGPTLLNQIDTLPDVAVEVDGALRMSISDINVGKGSALIFAGKINAGTVQNGQVLTVCPNNVTCVVKSIVVGGKGCPWAVAGQNAEITVGGIDETAASVGNVLCPAGLPIPLVSKLRAQIIVFEPEVPLTKGFNVLFHTQQLTKPAILRKLLSTADRKTGEVLKKKPRCLTKNTSAVVEIVFDAPICIELYSVSKSMGRFMLRYGGKTVAAGVVTELR